MTMLLNRRAFAFGAAAGIAATALPPMSQTGYTRQQATPAAGGGRFLLVTDQAAERLSVYSIPSLELTGELEGISINKHGGVLTVPDGRVLAGNDAASELVALTVDDAGVPAIVARAWVDGSGPKRSPCRPAAAVMSSRIAPGSTTAVRASGSIESTRLRWREKSSTSPGPIELPAVDVPPPRAVTGVACVRATARAAPTSSLLRGKATTCGTTR